MNDRQKFILTIRNDETLSTIEFLESLNQSKDDIDFIIDRILAISNHLMSSGQWDKLKEIIDTFQVHDYDNAIIMALPCSTFIGEKPNNILIARENYYFRAKEEFEKRGKSDEQIQNLFKILRILPNGQ